MEYPVAVTESGPRVILPQNGDDNLEEIRETLLAGKQVYISSLSSCGDPDKPWKELVDEISRLLQIDNLAFVTTGKGGILLSELRKKHGDKGPSEPIWPQWDSVALQIGLTDRSEDEFFSDLTRPDTLNFGEDVETVVLRNLEDMSFSSSLEKLAETTVQVKFILREFRRTWNESMNLVRNTE
jgi:hypothetical protein